MAGRGVGGEVHNMKKWFKDITTVGELRTRYKKLLKKYHPDNGGSLYIIQEINAEYNAVFAILRHQNETGGETSNGQETEEDKALRAVLNQIASYNMDIEVIGSWIWCFNCYAYKDGLKTLGFKYAPKKRTWTWHYGEYARYHKREIPIDDIRAEYGPQRVCSPDSINYHLN